MERGNKKVHLGAVQELPRRYATNVTTSMVTESELGNQTVEWARS